MENLLDLYSYPLNNKEPVICIDEKPVQLLGEKYPVRSLCRPGKVVKQDYEYIRKSTSNIFHAVEPKAGNHIARVYQRKTAKEFSFFLKEVVRKYPNCKTIHLVMDNLKTHSEKSLIKTFGKRQGSKIWKYFTVHYTPKHASWLNQAEIEISICSKQCLGKRRFENAVRLRSEVLKWERRANKTGVKINWRFSTKDARRKFRY